MNQKYFSAFRIPVFSVFAFLFFVTFARAQAIVPDEQIVREMTTYARKVEREMNLARPRFINVADTSKKRGFVIPENVKKASAEVSTLEQTAFNWLNQKRVEQGLHPIKWNEGMAQIARYHSDRMARGKYFAHKDPDGSMVNDRADLFGISDWQSIGENIAFNRGFKLPAESACQQWMNSNSHRENVLDKRWKEAGIGVAIAEDGTYYFTEVFMLR